MKIAISILLIPFIIWNLTVNPIIGVIMVAIYVLFLDKFYSGLFIGAITYIILLPALFNTITHMSEEYTDIINNGGELNALQVWNVYGLHLAMATVAYPLFPEAATETLLMHFPKDPGTVITIDDDFFLKSERFQNAIKKSDKGWIGWSSNDFHAYSKEARVALALSPTYYEKVGYTYETTTFIRYRPDQNVKLIVTEHFTLGINEAIFYYLQQKGLLFKYKMKWKAINI